MREMSELSDEFWASQERLSFLEPVETAGRQHDEDPKHDNRTEQNCVIWILNKKIKAFQESERLG
jgi:hypothetical protein